MCQDRETCDRHVCKDTYNYTCDQDKCVRTQRRPTRTRISRHVQPGHVCQDLKSDMKNHPPKSKTNARLCIFYTVGMLVPDSNMTGPKLEIHEIHTTFKDIRRLGTTTQSHIKRFHSNITKTGPLYFHLRNSHANIIMNHLQKSNF